MRNNLRHILPLALAISTIVLMGVDRVDPDMIVSSGGGGGGFSCGGVGGCANVEEGQETSSETGTSGSSSYVFRRSEIGATYTTGISASKSYKSSTQLGHSLSEGITFSDQYQTYHPMSRKILNRPTALEIDLDEKHSGD